MENSPISCISPIREEVITCAIPEESDVVSTPRRTFKRKSFLLSPGAKASRYASCSNLADLNGKQKYAIRMFLVLLDKRVGSTSIEVPDCDHIHLLYPFAWLF